MKENQHQVLTTYTTFTVLFCLTFMTNTFELVAMIPLFRWGN